MTCLMTPWHNWEDFHAGLYSTAAYTAEDVERSVALLSDADAFGEAAYEMVNAWPNAALHNLHHMWSGRNAWIGQASCLYVHGSPALATREAWGTLSNDQQRTANRVATMVRERWERNKDDQTLFDL